MSNAFLQFISMSINVEKKSQSDGGSRIHQRVEQNLFWANVSYFLHLFPENLHENKDIWPRAFLEDHLKATNVKTLLINLNLYHNQNRKVQSGRSKFYRIHLLMPIYSFIGQMKLYCQH